MAEILFKELSYRVVGAAIEVYNRIGPFYQEWVYQRAMEIELRLLKIPYSVKVPAEILYRGFDIGHGEADLVVEDSIVIELKAASRIHPKHVSQVLQYLATLERPLGLVINFGNIDRLEFRRVPFSESLEKLRTLRRGPNETPTEIEDPERSFQDK